MKHVIFDLGNVVFKFDPLSIYREFAKNDDEAVRLYEVTHQLQIWHRLDEGALVEDIIRKVQVHLNDPTLDRTVENILHNWYHLLKPELHMLELVRQLKTQKIGCYVLSNFSTQFHQFKLEHDFFSEFDGIYISADTKLVKPHKEVYYDFCDTFGLEPNQCYFIDDKLENIEGCRSIGMQGYHYSFDFEALKKDLEHFL